MTTFLKRSITLIACCLVVTTGFAQGSYPLLEWSPEYNARSAKFDRILQSSEQGFLPTGLQRRRSFQVLATNILRITIVTI